MRINYSKAIQESEEDLLSLEHRLRGQKPADRVRMLRLLKSGTVKSMKDCAPLVGYSLVQLTRWWERYRTAGLSELVKQQKPVGQPCKVTAEAWEELLAAMRKGDMATMEDAR
jgi:transposase